MKTLILFCLTFHQILCNGGIPSNEPSKATDTAKPAENAQQNNGKLPYEKLGILNRIVSTGLSDTNDSDDVTTIELQFLRKLDSMAVGEKVVNIVHTITSLGASSADACEKDFSSNPFISGKKIQISKQAGTIEEKPIEITRYDVNPAVIPLQVHKCSCTINEGNDDSKSICINGSAYITEGVNGNDSYFVLKKAQNSDNLNLRSHITLTSSAPQPEHPTQTSSTPQAEQPSTKPEEKPALAGGATAGTPNN